MSVSALGYIGIGAHAPEQWLQYGTRILGMMPARAWPGESWGMPGDPDNPGPASQGSGIGPDGSVYLKLDDHQWRVAVHPGAEGLRYLGFDAGDEEGFRTTLERLKTTGAPVRNGTPAEAAARSVRHLAHSRDPMGNAIEIYVGPTRDYRFHSPLGISFVAGKVGFGHVNLFVDDIDTTYEYYTRALGMRLSDYLVINAEAGMSIQFLHCNQRHHSVGMVKVGDIRGLHHVMFEVTGIDQVGCIMDRVQKAGMTITSTLGRHTNDHMLSFYMRGPSGFDVEIGCDPVQIDEHWVPNQFCEGDVWGHKGLTVEAIAEMASGLQDDNTGQR
ncbi:MAG: VOC family protein [Proteobacteria bacterium]|nr:VOC family protein [Pseudomonadota bacterium]HQR02772.1 VOC family protein [Rhodocyclaceae bacterium]